MSGKSFINIMNSSGPKTVPCGIPLKTSLRDDAEPLIFTYCVLQHKNDLIHDIKLYP